MNKSRTSHERTGFISILLMTVLCACGARQSQTSIQLDNAVDNPLSFTAVDVHERTVEVGSQADYITLLFFNGEETSDAMQPITANIAIHFYTSRALRFVNVSDMRSIAFWKRPFVAGAMQDAGARTIRRINRRLNQEGLAPLEGLHDHLFLINDQEGLITDSYPIPDPNETISAFVFHPGGEVSGPYDPENDLAALILEVEHVLQDIEAEEPQM